MAHSRAIRWPRLDASGGVDWSAVAALAATMTAAASLFVAVAVLREVRDDNHWQRITVALDTLWRFDGEWSSDDMSQSRSAAASALLEGHPSSEVGDVLDFFDEIAFLIDRGALDEETVWYRFYWPMSNYWFASQDYVHQVQQEHAGSWEHLERVMPRLAALEAKHRKDVSSDGVPSKRQMKDFLNSEVDSGQCEDDDDQETSMTPL